MGRSGHPCTHRQPRIMARYRSNVFSEGPGRQKGLFRARYSRNVFPNTVFHCFSPLKTYIRSLCCQQHVVRACISATYCHEEAFLPSGPPPGMHDNRFLPLFNAQPFHAGHSGGTPGEWPTSNKRKRLQAARAGSQDKGKRLARGPTPDGGAPGEEPALTAKVLPTGGSPSGNRGDSDWRLARREQGKSDWLTTLFNWRHPPFASALAFLLRSPFRSRLRQALHRARNR